MGDYTEESRDLTADVTALLEQVDAVLASDRCALLRHVPEERLLPAAGLRHTCMLLQKLDNERLSGDELVARLLARAHFEAWLVTFYLHQFKAEAVEHLKGAHKRSMQVQQERLNEIDRQVAKRIAEVTARNEEIAQQNAGIIARRQCTGEEIPLLEPVPVPIETIMYFDISKAIAVFADTEAAEINFEAIALKLRDEADQSQKVSKGMSVSYNLVYRGLSSMGAHPTYWVLNEYLTVSGCFIRVGKVAACKTPLALGATTAALVITAMLAQDVLAEFGHSDELFDLLVARWRPSGTE